MNDAANHTLVPIDISVEIVCAFVSRNALPASDLPALLTSVHGAVARLAGVATVTTLPTAPADPEIAMATPAQIRKSITPDALISFVDGKPYKTLKRHLGANGLDLATYRARFGLPSDYPSVAPNYSAARSALARSLGLGQGRATSPAPEVVGTATSSSVMSEKPKRGRPTKQVT